MRELNILDAKQAFAVPGEDSIVDMINPFTGKSWYANETLEQVRERYPLAEIVQFDDWIKAKAEKQDSPPVWEEVTEDKYNEMLEVLPPALWIAGGFLVGEPWDHHAGSGKPRFAAFIKRDGRYFTADRPMTRAEFKALFSDKYASPERGSK